MKANWLVYTAYYEQFDIVGFFKDSELGEVLAQLGSSEVDYICVDVDTINFTPNKTKSKTSFGVNIESEGFSFSEEVKQQLLNHHVRVKRSDWDSSAVIEVVDSGLAAKEKLSKQEFSALKKEVLEELMKTINRGN